MNPRNEEKILTGLLSRLEVLTSRERRMLLVSLEGLYERAYRRGFQHGTVYFEDHPGRGERDVSDWRFREIKREATPPPGAGGRMPIRRRMVIECRGEPERMILQALIEGEDA